MSNRTSIIKSPSLRRAGLALLLGALTFAGCDDESPVVPPIDTPADVSLDVTSLSFSEADVNLGETAEQTVTISNSGSGSLDLFSFTVSGPFVITDGGNPISLAPGGSASVSVAFDPTETGSATGSLQFSTNDPDMPTVQIALLGMGAVYRYTQVDREGIPTINTVFNHPPAFSKVDFNVAGPDMDLASYRGQFEVVLGAVANADPAATAALLLPDELPVSLAADVTAFGSLTGRALADDAVDVALSVVVGVAELQSDNVGANDVPFLSAFPYLAPAH